MFKDIGDFSVKRGGKKKSSGFRHEDQGQFGFFLSALYSASGAAVEESVPAIPAVPPPAQAKPAFDFLAPSRAQDREIK